MNFKLCINPVDVEARGDYLDFLNHYSKKGYKVKYAHKYFTLFEKSHAAIQYYLDFVNDAKSKDVIYILPYKDLGIFSYKPESLSRDDEWNHNIAIHLSNFNRKEIVVLIRRIIYFFLSLLLLIAQITITANTFTLSKYGAFREMILRYQAKAILLIPITLILLGAIISDIISIVADFQSCRRIMTSIEDHDSYTTTDTIRKHIYIKNLLSTFFSFAAIGNILLFLIFLI